MTQDDFIDPVSQARTRLSALPKTDTVLDLNWTSLTPSAKKTPPKTDTVLDLNWTSLTPSAKKKPPKTGTCGIVAVHVRFNIKPGVCLQRSSVNPLRSPCVSCSADVHHGLRVRRHCMTHTEDLCIVHVKDHLIHLSIGELMAVGMETHR